jgi:hypothetical protein
MLFAHNVSAGSLPAPSWLLGYVGAFVVLATAFALRGSWTRARLAAVSIDAFDEDAAWTDDVGIGRTRPWTQRVGQIAGLLALGGVFYAAIVGPDNGAANIAPVAVFVVWWMGMPLVCLAAGDVMRAVNPFAPVVQWVERMRPNLPSREHLAPAWTAAVFLWVFEWYFVAYHKPGSPRAAAVLLGAYAAAAIGGGILWGSSWLRRGEGFGGLSVGIAGLVRPRPGSATGALLPISVVVVSTTAFDALSGTTWWVDVAGATAGWTRTAVNTIGLVWITAAVTAVAMAAMRLVASAERAEAEADDDPADPDATDAAAGAALTGLFGIALLPVALGWFVAHNLTIMLLEGQSFVVLLSDPIGRGWNLFGTVRNDYHYGVLTAGWVRWVQLLALLVGHAAAVVLAHDGAIGLLGRRRGMRVTWAVAGTAAVSIVGAALLLLA